MTTNDEFTDSGELFGDVLDALHDVVKVALALDLVLVATGGKVLGKLEGDRKQDMEGIQDLSVE